MATATETFSATGRRKSAVARVVISPGSGEFLINDRAFEEFFPTLALQNQVLQPFHVAEAVNQYDVQVIVKGGGVTGQVGAIRLGISRALLQTNEELRDGLRGDDLLTRDSRVKERKKPGQPGARKRFQFSKR